MEHVLITGSARRLGSLIAEDLAGAGCFVWIHYRMHGDEAAALRDRIILNCGAAECVRADLTDAREIDRMLEAIAASDHGGLTTLINNASVIKKGTLGDTSAEDWDRLMDTNLKAVWYLSTRFADSFPNARRIITIGDASVSRGFAGHAVYGLSKYALKYLTEQMAIAYAPKIWVNLLSPGLVLQGDKEPDESWQNRVSRTLHDNGEIIEALLKGIRFLMTDPGLTGSELLIDNGLHLHGKPEIMK